MCRLLLRIMSILNPELKLMGPLLVSCFCFLAECEHSYCFSPWTWSKACDLRLSNKKKSLMTKISFTLYGWSVTNHFVLILSPPSLVFFPTFHSFPYLSLLLFPLSLYLLHSPLQFNPSTPLKTMLLCWGPYGLLAFYAAVENANLVSPKLRMVRTAST